MPLGTMEASAATRISYSTSRRWKAVAIFVGFAGVMWGLSIQRFDDPIAALRLLASMLGLAAAVGIWRLAPWMLGVYGCWVLAMLSSALLRDMQVEPAPWKLAAGLAPGAVIWLIIGYWVFRAEVWRRGREHALEHDLKLCTNCRYPLDSLPEHGRCPECGEAYDIAIVRPRWKQWYRA